MAFLPPTAALSNPTHKVVGPDGTEYFLIRLKGARLRIRVLYDAPNFVDITPAGSVSEGWGPSAADGVLMGSWIGPLAHHFAGAALESLPDGTHCVEVGDNVSRFDYQTDIIWRGWGAVRFDSRNVALRRSGINCGRYGRQGLPVTRPQIAEARAALIAHRHALTSGTYRRSDGPMIPVPAPTPGGPRFVQGVGTPVPADLLPEFLADADHVLAYLNFLESIPPLPQRSRPVAA